MADVQQMFHQVRVCEEDRDSLRFLWTDLDETRKPDEYQMTVHVFGAVDSLVAQTMHCRELLMTRKGNSLKTRFMQ